MMQEHSFLWDIVADLGAVWGEDCQRKTWSTLGQSSTGNVYESQRRAIVRERLEQYRTRLDASTPAQLHLNATLRANELGQLYQQSERYWPDLNADVLPLFTENMIRTLRDLTIGYAAASVIAYYQQGISLNLPASIRAKSDALAASADAQGLTDAGTFLGILNATTNGGRSQGDPQPRPKDAILNNTTAVSLLKIMQGAGLLDATYQWRHTNEQGKAIRHTSYEKAQFAFHIYSRCLNNDNTPQIPEWDKAFCDLWGLQHRTLSKAYADLATKGEKTQKRYAQMLTIFDTPTK